MKKYIYSLITLLVISLCSGQTSISQAEYFWDNDPGTGNGVAIAAADGNFNSAFEQLIQTGIQLPGTGLHKLCIRIKDNTGMWGSVFVNVVQINPASTSAIMSILGAEYFWDTDPGEGNGTPILATDGNFDSAFEQLSKTGITLPPIGLHVFNIRIKDNTGTWGPTLKNVVSVQTNLSNSDFELSGLKVYPNPVKNILKFSYEHKITGVTVYNFLGQQVMTKSFQINESEIDLSSLTSGTYFVTVKSENKAKTIKIIKE